MMTLRSVLGAALVSVLCVAPLGQAFLAPSSDLPPRRLSAGTWLPRVRVGCGDGGERKEEEPPPPAWKLLLRG